MRLSTATLLLASLLPVAACGPADTQSEREKSDGTGSVVSPDLSHPLSNIEAEDLTLLREEEKLARDVYLTLAEAWGLNPHANIADSEQQHMDAVKVYVDAYGLPDPVEADTVGSFANAEFHTLYGDLVDQGSASQVAALSVGATIEDLDIADIEEMKSHTDNEALLAMYGSLQCGSRNHMRAFYSALEAAGADYQSQYISSEELAGIVASARERCGK